MKHTVIYRASAILGTGAAVVLAVWRSARLPELQPTDSLPLPDYAGMILSGGVVVLLLIAALLTTFSDRERRSVGSVSGVILATTMMAAGALLAFSGVWDLARLTYGRIPFDSVAQTALLAVGATMAFSLCAIGGGVSWIVAGRRILRQDGTHSRVAGWESLLPVLWSWMRLACYEMSYTSATGWKTIYFDIFTFFFEMLFLLQWARYTAQVGQVRTGFLLFLALGTVLFSLSGAFVALQMSFSGGLVSPSLGIADFAVGLLALVASWTLAFGKSGGEEKADAAE